MNPMAQWTQSKKAQPMAVIDPEKINQILAECAELYVLPRFKRLQDHEISSKTSPRDLVTQADIDVEAHLERVLPDILPGSVVIGEEGVSRGDTGLDALSDVAQKVWVVDPIDGTHNFVHGKDDFGIMLACIINGETQMGWIYHVVEEGKAVAEKGSGAFYNGERLRINEAPRIETEQMRGFINPRFFPKAYHEEIRETAQRFERCESIHSAAHEYLRIARGQADFAVYSRIKAWDHLAGALLVQEAGGHVAQWTGEAYKPNSFDCGLIASSSQKGWNAVYAAFLDKKL